MKTNEELYKDIMEKLEFEPSLDHTNITVAANDGVVTLGGTVRTLLEKRIAERAVKSITDVKAVADELKVDISTKFKRTDVDIANAAIHALRWDVFVPADRIQVSVEDGRVTLNGSVDWWYQRNSAEKAVRSLVGVKSINNQIMIKPKVEANVKEVKTKIMSEFQRNAAIDANNIDVKVDANKVVLSGKVRSWAEMHEASRAAWSVPGVAVVDNRLSIGF